MVWLAAVGREKRVWFGADAPGFPSSRYLTSIVANVKKLTPCEYTNPKARYHNATRVSGYRGIGVSGYRGIVWMDCILDPGIRPKGRGEVENLKKGTYGYTHIYNYRLRFFPYSALVGTFFQSFHIFCDAAPPALQTLCSHACAIHCPLSALRFFERKFRETSTPNFLSFPFSTSCFCGQITAH